MTYALVALVLALAAPVAAQAQDMAAAVAEPPVSAQPAASAVARWETDAGVGVAPDLRERLIIQTDKTLAKPETSLLGPVEKAQAVDTAIDAYLSEAGAEAGKPRRYREILGQSLEERAQRYAAEKGLTGSSLGGGEGGFNPFGVFRPIDRTWTLILDAAPDTVDFRLNDLPLPRSAKDQYLVVQATARVLLKTASGFVCKVEVKRDGSDRTAHCRQA